MTATQDPAELPRALAEARPALRPEVELGRAHRRGTTVVHHVKDPATGWFYRVGAREHAVLSLMDGAHTVSDISAAYAARFGRLLGPAQWQQVFTMLGNRHLLAGATDPAALAASRERRDASEKAGRSLLRRRVPLVHPAPLFERVAPRLGPLFSPWTVVPGLLVALAVVVYALAGFGSLRADIAAGPGLLVYLGPSLLVTWGLLVLHESAHGLACTRFGGTVGELGVMWRFPVLAPYCKTDDVVLMPRGRGVAVAFAGIYSNLVALAPFVLVHQLSEPGGFWRGFTAAVVLFGAVSGLVNLVPFLELDGYHMLNNALGTLDLRGESYRYWGLLLRDRSAAREYPAGDRWAYGVYGAASVLFGLGVAGTLAVVWFLTMRPWFGPLGATAVLVVEAVVLVALARRFARRRKVSA
ncbi:M50 family metallopeptidase [Saccharothrix algeriensis]|uniref:M50 family metallopeptidase n=1 Tax=Saccharothrix algeriensis TaxID=173560 RepID=A0A8T8HXB0_9PSEU|nr:M50 family metallopeptidase [Saccharothrix algeriensis]MBM7814548.1 putative peptide zinc metalloprotease protein [Saccharothrix algeriensis]QTR02840.1 M50 family metallopeptidase [Saccharothrix algeriensis]